MKWAILGCLILVGCATSQQREPIILTQGVQLEEEMFKVVPGSRGFIEYYYDDLRRVDPEPEWRRWYDEMELCFREKGLEIWEDRLSYHEITFYTFRAGWRMRPLNYVGNLMHGMWTGKSIVVHAEPYATAFEDTMGHEFTHHLLGPLEHPFTRITGRCSPYLMLDLPPGKG